MITCMRAARIDFGAIVTALKSWKSDPVNDNDNVINLLIVNLQLQVIYKGSLITFDFSEEVREDNMKKTMIMALGGAVLLLVGLFLPMVSVTLAGGVGGVLGLTSTTNILSGTDFYGYLLLILSIVTIVLAVLKYNIGLWFTGIGALSTEVYVLANLISETDAMRNARQLQSNLLDMNFGSSLNSATKLVQTAEIQWTAWVIMIAGGILILAAAVILELQRRKNS